jgi:acyl-CoA synthetase (AMP-forming)/AMP-acid ligase II
MGSFHIVPASQDSVVRPSRIDQDPEEKSSVIRGWIEQAAARHGDDVYLADARGSQALTYAGLLGIVSETERRLDEAGLPRGARVNVRLADPVRYATALVALIAAGRVVVPLDPGAPDAEVARVIGVARPAGLVTGGTVNGNTVNGNTVNGNTVPPGGDPAGVDGEDTLPFGVTAFDLSPLTTGADGGGIFLCTSGTTGTPKGILLREEQLAHVASSVADWHRLSRADRGYCSLPLFHVNAEVVGLLATLRAGAYLAVDRKFSRRGCWDLISAERITWINAVPAIISILSMDPPASPPARLRFVRSASAPLPLATLERFERSVGVPVIETYGMTEAASMITANPLDGPRKPGSAGRPAGAEVRIGLPGGCPAGAGDIGRVLIRGAGVITAYASGGRPDAIDDAGWLDTGDLGYLDADGYLFLAGRSDDVINRGGEKIYPREIEEILLALPGVRSAAVVGVADEVLGERPVAYVVPEGGAVAGELEELLRAACALRLPRHKRPSEFWLVDEMPLGPTGKISRRLLKEAMALHS